MRRQRLILAALMATLIPGCRARDTVQTLGHEDMDSALWMRTSAEYDVLARDTYARALQAVIAAIREPTWSAIPEQAERLLATAIPDAPALPPAVILDIDETVLDTSDYQVEQILHQGQYDRDEWNAWSAKAEASLIPGVAEFVKGCHEAGVTVFYLTNRDVETERHTRRNLERYGLISPQAFDQILSKNERDDWTVDKTSRRNFVAERYRVLVLVGDDLNDFVWVGDKPTAQARIEAARRYATLWGQKWFLLPNANYGGWERAIQGYADELPREQKLQRKRDALSVRPMSDATSP